MSSGLQGDTNVSEAHTASIFRALLKTYINNTLPSFSLTLNIANIAPYSSEPQIIVLVSL
jgi:hypothetical protein